MVVCQVRESLLMAVENHFNVITSRVKSVSVAFRYADYSGACLSITS